MKIGIVTLYDDTHRDFGAITASLKKDYCQKHGYRFYLFTASLDKLRHPSWSKLPALLRSFADNDYLFWSDADALIVKTDTRLESFIDDRYQMIVSNDINGVTLGNFFLRNSSWSRDLIAQLYTMEDHRDAWWESSALMRLMMNAGPVRACIKHSGQAFNGYVGQPNEFILHLAAFSNAERMTVCRAAQIWLTTHPDLTNFSARSALGR